MIDSIDGGLEGDLGAMFEGLMGITRKTAPDNVYEEGAYIEPKKSASGSASALASSSPSPLVSHSANTDKKVPPKPFKPLPVKALKERFNYASTDCAATVRSANKEAKGANSILYESKDQYLLNKCSANKFVIINLCESILVDTIVLANFEFFSSTFKDFRVYVADRYPTKDWKLLGQWQARNTRDLQVFKVQDRAGWSEYMKIEFLTHYGHEYYCPLSLVRVHGMPMMEYFNIVERKGLSGEGDEDVFLDDESLWPSEVRDEIIQPKRDVTNTSEFIPVATEGEEELTVVIPPEPNIQESIYKTIMKRLNVLELNATLSQRYLDEQNKMLNTVFMEMEKRHQDQLILLLGRLNDTASLRLDNMVCGNVK
ncbi:hypothetical protein PHYBLDRAFT_135489 [Phycomyces blakesleeanus NRRL 1555(-)]|uniref:SUN-like protein 1 n=1 Tax=Phycomyces blakesleeanus (strain ATCC 8743b / DSM 1359 / FGSC 10004 / NBRC 33097 / NRRL 1555) TaxID=763407 RepID=A0A162TU26_PHYB8|nr:hypothetical protein PHYBLDRAFT_135489 [Phycomyces blakesleeanus NRRL 1555(-)]OAD69833.1 hypothetical protein PHYBLDRAFT_135489 [Phycomyces blakesleeanus NRRL 1555(-)]|eukprot:XP_018287873.1 hypothetical protein PHYBLDRAFT_135489 [Phycomyces blakesleeanus NRRL 1555(-)]